MVDQEAIAHDANPDPMTSVVWEDVSAADDNKINVHTRATYLRCDGDSRKA